MIVLREFRSKASLKDSTFERLISEAFSSSLGSLARSCNGDQAGDAVSGDPPPISVTPKNGS